MVRLRGSVATVVAVAVAVALALLVVTGGPAGAGNGLEGHHVTFRVASKDSDTACVSYYETTKKNGPSKHFEQVRTELVDLPCTGKVGTGTKVRHWLVTAWATTDCTSRANPDGTVRCTISVDGTRKARAKGTDQLIFCTI